MTDLLVHPAERPLEGIVPGPPDAAACELALVLAALAPEGSTSELNVRGLPSSPLPQALRSLGVAVQQDGDCLSLTGVGLFGLRASDGPLELDRSIAAMAALCGALAGQQFDSTVVGRDDVMSQVMAMIARPLRRRGGQIEGMLQPEQVGVLRPPIQIAAPTGGAVSELHDALAVGDWPGKIAALFSGLLADGPTVLRESLVGHERVEHLLTHAGADISAGGPFVRLEPAPQLRPLAGQPPADAALAAVLVAAALAVPASRIGVRHVGASPSRRGLAELLVHAGARLTVNPRGDRWGEPCADWAVTTATPTRALRIGGELARRVDASLPILAALASCAAPGQQSELLELPVALDFPGQPAATVAMLRSFGIDGDLGPEGLRIRASRPAACTIDPLGDPHIAMASAALALAADGACRIERADCIVESFPRFVGSLRALGARIDVEP